MFKQLRPALGILGLMTLITGVAYPLLVTSVAQVAFPEQANGSLLRDDRDQLLGSALLAQNFEGAQWFQPRPSAAGFATVASGASNLAQSNPALAERIAKDAQRLVGEGGAPVPLELVTTSASGLDPHLSPAAARWQVARIAAARRLPVDSLERLIERYTERSLVGPDVVNVLALNLALADNRASVRNENAP
ncbi:MULTISPECIES: potassium-transporting ATPase subunit KdpC [unclassified Pseudomonas]|uniref:potassium-transporting ATPase subunit KdpC n=1 Tax=unclassified Pseudomonas TaxID=196821 RepID=UPI002446B1F2|nr:MULTISPECIES: potassium-transporting ATPase subunit KdpC [unclassified Pseudomonas]MDG9929569.1 potassium-transporting ATPase subunit KdpC [Pseudomonas sp. GD04042]MDH0483344.1 potassium-transporting ATPase subunit KdpC [Pseudomonas sp. GD04015]MDH0604853.1 potassium-transporting ATPase subunit KdpC [Pseudomonas sp. GD03869]